MDSNNGLAGTDKLEFQRFHRLRWIVLESAGIPSRCWNPSHCRNSAALDCAGFQQWKPWNTLEQVHAGIPKLESSIQFSDVLFRDTVSHGATEARLSGGKL